MNAIRAGDLDPSAAVVIAVAPPRPDRRKARLARRDLPLIVGRGQVVNLAADEELLLREEWTLESERVADLVRSEFRRDVAGNERVIERVVIEHGCAEAERRHQAVDAGEPVFAVAHVGHEPESSRRLAQADDENALA